MVDTGKIKPEHPRRDGVDRDPAERRADGRAYTADDVVHFDRLNDGVRVSAGLARSVIAPDKDTPSGSAFTYTESDDRAFDRLLNALCDVRAGQQGQTASQRIPGQGFGYTEEDDKAFSRLMPAERSPAGHDNATTDRARPPAAEDRVFQFTSRDDEAFGRIIAGTPLGPPAGAADARDRTGKRDRDVGPIRIVEFDKERARARETGLDDGRGIKIRYFD